MDLGQYAENDHYRLQWMSHEKKIPTGHISTPEIGMKARVDERICVSTERSTQEICSAIAYFKIYRQYVFAFSSLSSFMRIVF